MILAIGDTSLTRPVASVEASTNALTAARVASVICCRRSTSARTPLLALRYTSSSSRPSDEAMTRGRPTTSSSGRSISAIDTKVATASSADGGTPTVWRPIGSKRDSISMSLRYTSPTSRSRVSRSRSLASNAVASMPESSDAKGLPQPVWSASSFASSASFETSSSMSRSRLHETVAATIELTIDGPRASFSRRPWYDDTSSESSLSPL
mmetsp:Transcript_11267/g.45618  ORF Transcript_11267/g.45618 Transcript_11267/m.45618 type:complete len:210 (+) Transcript_11267:1853-2482(+)